MNIEPCASGSKNLATASARSQMILPRAMTTSREPAAEHPQPTSDHSDADADASFSEVLHDALRRLSNFPEYARFCDPSP
ncbi:hypothetical protein QM012_003296 [Aureobasidium pullulans]|uniref:RGS domain-containing protein n=1 Tax=Aureobasidium pullulans TaxID=5580 RepID=A0ABR0T802_AURPU